MPPVKTKVLAASDGPVDPATPAPAATPDPVNLPEVKAPTPAVPAATPPAATPEPPPPLRPGLETPPAAPLPPDPFELLSKFVVGDTYRNMRALAVPGGCIVRVTAVRGTNFAESHCFVPNVKIQDGKLVSDSAPL